MTTIRQIAETFGLPMIDAKRALDVKITAADCKGAVPHNQTKCAIARALKRSGAKEAYVLRTTAWIDDGDHLVRYALPPSLQKEVVSFDRSGDFRPGSYALSPAPNAKRNRAQRAGKHPQKVARRRLKKATNRKPRKAHRSEGVRGQDLDP
jgi:hypothetical protein